MGDSCHWLYGNFNDFDLPSENICELDIILYYLHLKSTKYGTKNEIISKIINELKERADPECSLKSNYAIEKSLNRLIDRTIKDTKNKKPNQENKTWIEKKLNSYKANFTITSLKRKKIDSETIDQNSSQKLPENEIPKRIYMPQGNEHDYCQFNFWPIYHQNNEYIDYLESLVKSQKLELQKIAKKEKI